MHVFVCMYVCDWVHLFVRVRLCACLFLNMYAFLCVYVHICVCICALICVSVYICMSYV